MRARASLLGFVLVGACKAFGVTGAIQGADAGATDAGIDGAGSDVNVEASASCPIGDGPPMVRLGDVCVDSTPVTNDQYRKLAAATHFDGSTCQQQALTNIDVANGCAGLGPSELAPAVGDPASPVVCVTLCDARAICRAAGKHLCGGIDGKPLEDPEDIGPDRDEWTHACTENGAHPFPTGKTWSPSGCVGPESGLTQPLPVDRTPRCEGPKGAYDLVGNVVTWIDACAFGGDCREAGESFAYRPAKSVGLGDRNDPGRCDGIDSDPPSRRADDVGIRCCAAPL